MKGDKRPHTSDKTSLNHVWNMYDKDRDNYQLRALQKKSQKDVALHLINNVHGEVG